MCEIVARRSAVERIARRSGYPRERAEDIAQDAALALLENRNLRSQSHGQAYIDALRSGGEGTYSRAGISHQPLYESQFEHWNISLAGIACENDLELRAIARSDLSDAVSCFEILRPKWRSAIEMYLDGAKLVEISERLGCCESRVSQLIKLSRLEIKKAVVSARSSRQEQRRREFAKSRAVSSEIQARSRMEKRISFAMEAFRCKAIQGMVSFTLPKIPQSIFRSF